MLAEVTNLGASTSICDSSKALPLSHQQHSRKCALLSPLWLFSRGLPETDCCRGRSFVWVIFVLNTYGPWRPCCLGIFKWLQWQCEVHGCRFYLVFAISIIQNQKLSSFFNKDIGNSPGFSQLALERQLLMKQTKLRYLPTESAVKQARNREVDKWFKYVVDR